MAVASGTGEQSVAERDDFGGSAFTHHLLKVLAGGAANENGTVTLNSLFQYVSMEVALESPRITPFPVLKVSASSDPILTAMNTDWNILRNNRHALIIGTNEFNDKNVQSLRYSEKRCKTVHRNNDRLWRVRRSFASWS